MLALPPLSSTSTVPPSALGAAQQAATSDHAHFEAALARQAQHSAATPRADVGKQFEAAMLTPLMAALLPPEDSAVWGGSAGKLWRSLFAEELAAATAQSGGVGIAAIVDEAIAQATGDEG